MLCECGNEECIVHAGENCENEIDEQHVRGVCDECQEVWDNFHAALEADFS